MDAILQMVGSAGIPTSFIGVVLFLYLTQVKHMATVKAEHLERNNRLSTELAEKTKELHEVHNEVIALKDRNNNLLLEKTRLEVELIHHQGKEK